MTWRNDAACRSLSTDEAMRIFFPPVNMGRGEPDYTEAKAICATCPVREACLDDAMRTERGQAKSSRHGMFGGRTPSERWALALRRGDRSKKGPAKMDRGSIRHGTHVAYTYHRCRCEDCRQFNSRYMADRRARGAA